MRAVVLRGWCRRFSCSWRLAKEDVKARWTMLAVFAALVVGMLALGGLA
jgi:hypothetical protein